MRRRRFLCVILSLWLAIQPLAVELYAQADEDAAPPPVALPAPMTQSHTTDALIPDAELVKPVKYLLAALEVRQGSTEAQRGDRAWANWCMTMNSAYGTMDEGSQDVFGFYSALKTAKDIGGAVKKFGADDISGYVDKVVWISNVCSNAFAFLGNTHFGTWGENLFAALTRNFARLNAAVERNRFLQAVDFIGTPTKWVDKTNPAKGGQAYFQWVRSKVPGGADTQTALTNGQGVARTIGIGLSVISLTLSVIHLATSYDTVKTIVNCTFGALWLVAMFCPPPVGQILQVGLVIWGLVTFVGDLLGKYQRRWRDAYRNSYWFLHEQDLTFKSFYDNREALRPEEKCASLLLAERDFRDLLATQQPKTEQEQKDFDRGKRIWESLEKQGVVMSYYAKGDFTMPDLEFAKLCDLWHMKADFMSWKPTEKETDAKKKRGFFGKVMAAVNPMTYISWAGNKLQSREYNREIREHNWPRHWFNPDFYLVKKYQNFQLLKRARGGIFDTISLRIEQAPFNYLPLIGIDGDKFTQSLLAEALDADAMVIGQKEMVVMRLLAKAAQSSIREKYKEMRDRLEKFRSAPDGYETMQARVTALRDLADAYERDPEAACADVFSACEKAFGWRWADLRAEKTGKSAVTRFRADIEQALQMLPITCGIQAAEFVLMEDTVQANRDTAVLMKKYGQTRLDAAQHTDQVFANPDLRRFVAEGAFLNEKGQTLMNWLGEIYPPAEELRKASTLFLNEARGYQKQCDEFPLDELARTLDDMNRMQRDIQQVVTSWKRIGDDAGIRVVVDPGDPEIFPVNGFAYPLHGCAPLDPDQPMPGAAETVRKLTGPSPVPPQALVPATP